MSVVTSAILSVIHFPIMFVILWLVLSGLSPIPDVLVSLGGIGLTLYTVVALIMGYTRGDRTAAGGMSSQGLTRPRRPPGQHRQPQRRRHMRPVRGQPSQGGREQRAVRHGAVAQPHCVRLAPRAQVAQQGERVGV